MTKLATGNGFISDTHPDWDEVRALREDNARLRHINANLVAENARLDKALGPRSMRCIHCLRPHRQHPNELCVLDVTAAMEEE